MLNLSQIISLLSCKLYCFTCVIYLLEIQSLNFLKEIIYGFTSIDIISGYRRTGCEVRMFVQFPPIAQTNPNFV